MVETIYALGSSMTTLVKIGYTAGSIERRMQSLQCGHPVELIIRAQVDVAGYGEQIEQAIHALLEPQRRTGEWFEVSMDQQTLEGLVRQAGGICAERRAQAATSRDQNSLRTPPTPVSTPFDYPALAGKVGYARVSTVGQSVAIQLERLRATGCHKIFEEKASGVNAARPRLNACLEYLREGDTLVVTRIDRLARSILHLCQIGALLAHKGVHLLVLEGCV